MYLHTYGVITTRLFMSTPLLLEPSAGYGNTSLISLISLILHVHTCDIPSISPWNLKLFRCFTNLLLYCLLVLQSAPPPILQFSNSPILQLLRDLCDKCMEYPNAEPTPEAAEDSVRSSSDTSSMSPEKESLKGYLITHDDLRSS